MNGRLFVIVVGDKLPLLLNLLCTSQDSAFALLDVYGAVRLANLTNCDIYLGMIKGPLYVENVKDCR